MWEVVHEPTNLNMHIPRLFFRARNRRAGNVLITSAGARPGATRRAPGSRSRGSRLCFCSKTGHPNKMRNAPGHVSRPPTTPVENGDRPAPSERSAAYEKIKLRTQRIRRRHSENGEGICRKIFIRTFGYSRPPLYIKRDESVNAVPGDSETLGQKG